MKNRLLGLPFLLCAIGARAGGLTIDEQSVDFGEKYQFTEVERDLKVWNRSNDPITFKGQDAKKSGASLTFQARTLAPGQSAEVHIKLPTGNHVGAFSTRVSLETEEGGKPASYDIVLKGYVDSVLDDTRPGIDFGAINVTGKPVEKSIALHSTSDPQMRLTRVIESPNFIAARIDDDGHELLLTPKKFDVLGFSKGAVQVALDSKLQPQARVTVLVNMLGNVVPDQDPLNFGLQRPNTLHPVRLQLTSRDGMAFDVGKATVDDTAHIAVDAAPCLPAPRVDCRAFLLSIKKDEPHGQVLGQVVFDLPDTHQTLNIHLTGLYLADDMAVETLEHSAPPQSVGQRQTDLTQLLNSATAASSDPIPGGTGPLITWNVANEAGIYGYAIYRSDAVDGKFVRVNDLIVKAGNAGDNVTATYNWRDTSATIGKEYWYYVTIFYNRGNKVQLTGPHKVIAR